MRTNLDDFTWHTLDAMADDWESLDQIAPHVERFLGPLERSRMAEVLVELVSEKLLKAMEPPAHQQFTAEMILETPTKYWFGMTPEGRALWHAEGNKYGREHSD